MEAEGATSQAGSSPLTDVDSHPRTSRPASPAAIPPPHPDATMEMEVVQEQTTTTTAMGGEETAVDEQKGKVEEESVVEEQEEAKVAADEEVRKMEMGADVVMAATDDSTPSITTTTTEPTLHAPIPSTSFLPIPTSIPTTVPHHPSPLKRPLSLDSPPPPPAVPSLDNSNPNPTSTHAPAEEGGEEGEGEGEGEEFEEVEDPFLNEESAAYKAVKSASEWNGLLRWARKGRGPQWDWGTGQYHVDIASSEYYSGVTRIDSATTTTTSHPHSSYLPGTPTNMHKDLGGLNNSLGSSAGAGVYDSGRPRRTRAR